MECEQSRRLIDADSTDPALADHLDTCPDCRDYRVLAERARGLLERLESAEAVADPGEAFSALRARASRERRTTAYALAGAVTSLTAFFWLLRSGWDSGLLILVCWFVGSTVVAVWSSRVARRANRLARSSEFLRAWRRELSIRIAVVKWVSVLVGLESLVALGLLATGALAGPAPLLLLAPTAVLIAGVAYTWMVEIPVLRAELALLAE
tara:strand:+ start:1290 stop:1919 length:630 start_codon:yes stop_codon:yes gene_type:complete